MVTKHWRAFGAVTAALIGFSVLVGRAEIDPFHSLDAGVAAADAKAPKNAATDPASATEPPQKNSEPCQCIGELESTSAKRIKDALRKPLPSAGFDYAETPLEEVVSQLQEEYDISIQIDAPALEATGLDPSEAVTMRLRNVSLRSALRLMLTKLQLTYVVRDEVLLITTPEEAESQLLTCVYDVRNLVDKPPEPKGATAWADYNPLVGAITECIVPDSWKENGKGAGSIRSIGPGFLVIFQTQAVHDEISQMLTALREMRQTVPVSNQ